MHKLLSQLLTKYGVQSSDELQPEEKVVFEQWKGIMDKEELTTADIKKFCETQIDVIENKWTDYNTHDLKKAEWIPYHTVYKTLLKVIDSPRSARERLEQQLTDLLNK